MPEDNIPWLEIAVEVATIDAEIAADLLRQACPGGVAIETPSRLDPNTETYVPDDDAPSLVKGYVEPAEGERVRAGLKVALQAAPLQRPALWRQPRLLEEADWRDSWKKYFGVLRMGERLVVAPSWVDYRPREGDLALRIDPGMAFGTGQHPTTAMSLAALEALVTGGERVLDLGCGSGILAIAAAKLGAGRVLALDVDPQAIKATRENAVANGVSGQIEARTGSLDEADEQFDVIVANISGLTLERLAPALYQALRDGGRLVASGFLEDAVDGLTAVFEAAGFAIERATEEGVWRAVIARRGR
jgi:ribosomal protein L11 methyltransferase